jgi:UDP:flavonoid glycosyltransferase YjiC (YdhE family)
MPRFLFTMLPADDLGLPTRLVPIARALADRGHEVAMFNPAPAPSKLIASAGLQNLPMPERPAPTPTWNLEMLCSAWDVEHFLAAIYDDTEYVRGMTAIYVDLIRVYAPDVVVDSFDLLACLAARALGVKLATVLQGNFHPASHGFLWWQRERPAGLPSAATAVNKVAAEYGLAPHPRCVDRLAGDLCLIVGTPESDPLADSANVTYVGPILWQAQDAVLPEQVSNMRRPLIWVYSGNPRYFGEVVSPGDSIVVIRSAIAALGESDAQVVLTTGYQELPPEIGALPSNFRHAAYLPGLAMARHCDLMVHHGGHSSVMTSLMAGTPAVIIPTITERESNGRRLAALGAGEVVVPSSDGNGEKHIDLREFSAKVQQVLEEPAYRQSAQRVAQSMAKYGGAEEAATRIENFAASTKRRNAQAVRSSNAN